MKNSIYSCLSGCSSQELQGPALLAETLEGPMGWCRWVNVFIDILLLSLPSQTKLKAFWSYSKINTLFLLCSVTKSGFVTHGIWLGVVAYGCNSSAWVVEAGGSGIWGYSCLHSKSGVSLVYRRPCSKNQSRTKHHNTRRAFHRWSGCSGTESNLCLRIGLVFFFFFWIRFHTRAQANFELAM